MMSRSDKDSSHCDRSPLLVSPTEQKEEEEQIDDKEEEEYDLDQVGEDFTNHTIYMRRALKYCRTLLLTAHNGHGHHDVQPPTTSKHQQRSSTSTSTRDIVAAARNLQHDREQGLRDFWGLSNNTHTHMNTHMNTSETESSTPSSCWIPIVSDPSPTHFRRTFLHANVPCIIQGPKVEAHFGGATSNWIHPETGTIDRAWFRTRVGADTLVPVRRAPQQHQQPHQHQHQLDEDGRAVECETRHMPLEQWIDILDGSTGSSGNIACEDAVDHPTLSSSCYLKDWHLVAWLESQPPKNGSPNAVAAADAEEPEPTPLPLYHVPAVFPYDLLNGFLTRHTPAGDYRFVYWGPAHSTTELHSDVLNSYSWSYNVCGCKEWTFYPPVAGGGGGGATAASSLPASDEEVEVECHPPRQQEDDPDLDPDPAAATSVVVLQHAGECMFVPSGWKHRVVNTKETLSINHNWITTCNLDLTWKCCLQTEMRAIEIELAGWGLAADCWDARENMLLGCVGLDVTCFFLMILSRALELLQPDSIDHDDNDDDDDWEIRQFDLVCLGDMLSKLLGDKVLHAHERLAASLAGDKPAAVATEIAKTVLNMIDLSEC